MCGGNSIFRWLQFIFEFEHDDTAANPSDTVRNSADHYHFLHAIGPDCGDGFWGRFGPDLVGDFE